MEHQAATKNVRRYNHYTSVWNVNCIHLRNPWVTAWWSAAFPGFGHIHLGFYLKGFILFFWEILINTQSKINLAMVYTFTGKVEQAKEVLDTRLLIIYMPVYLFCIWDSYRLTVDLNNHYHLAKKESAAIVPFIMNEWGMNLINKRKPALALVWSLLFPGLGSLYIHRLPSGFFAIAWTATIIYFLIFLMLSNVRLWVNSSRQPRFLTHNGAYFYLLSIVLLHMKPTCLLWNITRFIRWNKNSI